MRLLTHNVLNNNSPNAKGNGYPLRLIQVTSVRIDPTSAASSSSDDADGGDEQSKVEFIKGIVPTLHWPALVQVSHLKCKTKMQRLGVVSVCSTQYN
jgi:hypothetical protein